MKIFLAVVVIVHGFIHFMGFTKAFRLAEMSQITQPISKPQGVVWLITGILFLFIAVLILFNQAWWWIPGLVVVITSQLLITLIWGDGKFGTIPNVIIFIAIIFVFSSWNFQRQINQEIHTLLPESQVTDNRTIVTEKMIQELPSPVKKWLNHIGMVGKPKIETVYFKQRGLMKLKPEQNEWTNVKAEQYVTLDQPAFLWTVNMPMLPFVEVVGRDLFMDGQGEMKIKIASLIPVANSGHNEKINQSSMQRFLMEISLYPSAALRPYIMWEAIDEQSAKATMKYKGVSGSATFYFSEEGDLLKVIAFRYKEEGDAKPTECIAEIKQNHEVNGLNLPKKIDISWMLDNGKFTWYKLEAYDVNL